MPIIKGKETLCSCEKKYFKSVQGLEGHTLFARFNDIEIVINNRIDKKYRHFLAHPVEEEESITWFSIPYHKTPTRLSELQNEERNYYEQIKIETLAHFKSVIDTLKNEGKNSEAICLEGAIKFINNDFVYCFENKVVLGIWGMQLKEDVREPLGIAMKNLYLKKKQIPPDERNESEITPFEETKPEEPVNPYKVTFNAGDNGTLNGNYQIDKNPGDFITESDIPAVEPKEGYEFTGWDRNPYEYSVNGDTSYTAQYKQIVPIVPIDPQLPWYRQFWNWLRGLFFGRGCLRFLLWLLLLLLLLLLFCWLFRSCRDSSVVPIPDPINEKPWIKDDPRVSDGGGGIYDPGNPYKPVPTPPEYRNVLPPNQGVLPPIDTSKIIREPSKPVILSNRLNILMENRDKSIMDLAKEFKKKYPDERYKVVYYDDVVKRMQIEVPAEDRLKVKAEIPAKFAPEYQLFVFDESLFENGNLPNDPALSDPNKSWYLKTINAEQAWDISLGSPKLTIAVVDNGFSLNHPELKGKVVMPYNVWQHSKDVFSQQVDHGTHVAGTVLAIANNNKGLCGIAPECAFMPVQVANKQGLMTTTSILDGILYALYQGADVINVSLGMQFSGSMPENEQNDLQNNHFKEEERLWNKVMEISNNHNAIVVIAAGNTNMLAGVNPMNRPKNFIVVSAVDKSNQEYTKAGFSNYGNYSTISAPGVDIYSTVGNNSYTVMSGTSMAAPIVTGAVALMKSLKKELSAEQIVCILQGTGKPVEGKVGNLVQIDKALEMVKSGKYTDCKRKAEIPSTGDVQVLLSWNNYNDLDLVCTDPNNQVVWYKNKHVSSGGQLEIDMNVNYPDNNMPIENIYWPTNGAPNGTYRVHLLYSRKHIDIDETPYKITVKYGNKTEEYKGTIKRKDNNIPICTFTLNTED